MLETLSFKPFSYNQYLRFKNVYPDSCKRCVLENARGKDALSSVVLVRYMNPLKL